MLLIITTMNDRSCYIFRLFEPGETCLYQSVHSSCQCHCSVAVAEAVAVALLLCMPCTPSARFRFRFNPYTNMSRLCVVEHVMSHYATSSIFSTGIRLSRVLMGISDVRMACGSIIGSEVVAERK